MDIDTLARTFKLTQAQTTVKLSYRQRHTGRGQCQQRRPAAGQNNEHEGAWRCIAHCAQYHTGVDNGAVVGQWVCRFAHGHLAVRDAPPSHAVPAAAARDATLHMTVLRDDVASDGQRPSRCVAVSIGCVCRCGRWRDTLPKHADQRRRHVHSGFPCRGVRPHTTLECRRGGYRGVCFAAEGPGRDHAPAPTTTTSGSASLACTIDTTRQPAQQVVISVVDTNIFLIVARCYKL